MRGRIPRITANTTFVCGSVRAPQPRSHGRLFLIRIIPENMVDPRQTPTEPEHPTAAIHINPLHTQAAIAFWKSAVHHVLIAGDCWQWLKYCGVVVDGSGPAAPPPVDHCTGFGYVRWPVARMYARIL